MTLLRSVGFPTCLLLVLAGSQEHGALETLTSTSGLTTVGGGGGGMFPSVEDSTGVKLLRAWMGQAIDTLYVEWFSGKTTVIGRTRASYSSGYTASIVLTSSELVQGSVYACKDSSLPSVSCIEFTTTAGQSFSACDTSITGCSYLYASTTTFLLSGFFGKSGNALNQIGFYARTTDSTTAAPTAAPTTAAPTTIAPTTAVPTTIAPTTAAPTTIAPSTAAPTTSAPTTAASTTIAPTTAAPSTSAPTTAAPTTIAPTTAPPSTSAPTTAAPTTIAPNTAAPTTSAPTTSAPTTSPPTTVAPTTIAPTTAAPTTSAPVTAVPTMTTTTATPTGRSTSAPTADASSTKSPSGSATDSNSSVGSSTQSQGLVSTLTKYKVPVGVSAGVLLAFTTAGLMIYVKRIQAKQAQAANKRYVNPAGEVMHATTTGETAEGREIGEQDEANTGENGTTGGGTQRPRMPPQAYEDPILGF